VGYGKGMCERRVRVQEQSLSIFIKLLACATDTNAVFASNFTFSLTSVTPEMGCTGIDYGCGKV
jgi:hypothetical protein